MQLRSRGSGPESAVAQLSTLGIIRALPPLTEAACPAVALATVEEREMAQSDFSPSATSESNIDTLLVSP